MEQGATSLISVKLSGADPVGCLYSSHDGYIRKITTEARPHIEELFRSGFLGELSRKGFFPFSEIIQEGEWAGKVKGELLVAHQAIYPLAYPREWSFAMLQTAALAYLDIVEIAFRYGYTLCDAHPFNFVFNGVTPVWVDLGSFCKISAESPHPWLPEYLTCFLVPLQVWEQYPFLAQKLISSPLPGLNFEESISFGVFSRFKLDPSGVMCKAICKVLNIDNYIGSNFILRNLKFVLQKKTIERVNALKKTIGLIQCENVSTWAQYHDAFLSDDGGELLSDKRFEAIITKVMEINPRSILELAGNAGVLSENIARRMPNSKVICTDYDPLAIDALLSRCKNNPLPNLSFAVLDFMCSEASNAEILPQERLRCDCVLALAVTHHLLLTQGYSFADIFLTIKGYASKNVFIEYMPLGLYAGGEVSPLPDWYAEDFFRANFENFFVLDHVEQLDENRILYCGTIR